MPKLAGVLCPTYAILHVPDLRVPDAVQHKVLHR
jgi:hypothetical protein